MDNLYIPHSLWAHSSMLISRFWVTSWFYSVYNIVAYWVNLRCSIVKTLTCFKEYLIITPLNEAIFIWCWKLCSLIDNRMISIWIWICHVLQTPLVSITWSAQRAQMTVSKKRNKIKNNFCSQVFRILLFSGFWALKSTWLCRRTRGRHHEWWLYNG